MNSHKFRGLGVAIITPFGSNKKIDYAAFEKIINHQITGGVNYIVLHGSTGEAATLTMDERRESLDFAIKTIQQRVPIVLGLGSNNTAASIEVISNWDSNGVDALLVASPSYNKPSQEGIYQHFAEISKVSKLPIILYNVPGRTSSNMSFRTTLRLANDFANIVAIKEASGDLQQMIDIISHKPDDFILISGDDPIAVPVICMGGEGLISVLGNAYTNICSDMVNNALEGDFVSARKSSFRLNKITKLVFAEGNPAGIKEAMHGMGLCDPYLRLPLSNVSEELKDKINKESKKING